MKKLMQSLFISSLGIATFCASFQLSASEWFNQNQLEGFISQSVIHSSDNNFLSRSDDNASVDMWEAGALFSTKVYQQISFSTQIRGRQVSESSGNDVRLDYAFFSFPFNTDNSTQLGLRLGRIRSSHGFYNETRDIPHTRTGIFMPQSVYYDQTRNSFYSADGIEFFANKYFDDQTLGFQIFLSRPVIDRDETGEASELNASNLKGNKSLLAKISFGSEFEGWRGAFTYYRPEYRVDVRPVFPLDPSLIGLPGPVTDVTFYADDSSFYSETMLTSLEYNQLDWSITAEYARSKIDSTANLDINRTINNSPFAGQVSPIQASAISTLVLEQIVFLGHEEGFYVQGLYRWGDSFESYVRYDSSRLRAASYADPQGHFDDINIGTSWQPDDHWLVRGELHYIDGWARLFARDNPNPTNRYWTLAALQVAYRW